MEGTNVVTSVFDIFTAVGTWFGETVPTWLQMFWGADGPTVLGVILLSGAGVGLIYGGLNFIRGFFRFNG